MVDAKPVIQEWTCQGCWTTYDTEKEAEICCTGKCVISEDSEC